MTTRTDGPALRVALVIDDSLDRNDGVQQSVLALGRWLSGAGHTVHYVTSRTTRTDLPHVHSVADSIPVRFNQNSLRIPLPARARVLAQVLREGDFDVVHVQMPYSPLLAGRLVSRLEPHVALVGTFLILPASGLTTLGMRVLALAQRRQLRRFDSLIAISEPAALYVKRTLRRTSQVVAAPVPTRQFIERAAVVPDRSGAPEAAVGSAGRPARIVFLGRLVPRKGARNLLEAVAHLERTTELHLEVVIGGAGALLEQLRRRAEELRSPVSFPGRVPEESKGDLLADADVVALPATGGESFGISVVEALACATGPVVCGDNPGYRSVMGPFPLQLADAEDPVALAGAIERAVRDQQGRAQIVRQQREHALTFDTATVSRQVVEVYRAAVAGRAGISDAPARGADSATH